MLRLGYTVHDGKPVMLSLDERRQGTYIIGTTGTGKSTLLKNIIFQDMLNDREHGLCLLDPHGDLIDELLQIVPEQRRDDVILFDPMDTEYPIGLNLLDCNRDDPLEVRWVISTVMGTLERLFSHSWGPRLEHVLRYTLLTAMRIPGSTLLEVSLLLQSEAYRTQMLSQITDPLVQQFWADFPKSHRDRYELVSSTLNKLTPFIADMTMQNIVGQATTGLDLAGIMNSGKILFVNLSKGDLGEDSSALLGSVLVNLVLIAALRRRSIPADQREPFHLIADEFQNFASESFAILQSEARKYGVDVVVAHQYRDQLDLTIKGSTLNVGNLIALRLTGRDAYELAMQFDNTPPPPETRVEPVYGYMDYQGREFLVETQLSTGEGKLYQEVEQPQRPYNDVEAERANQLSILPDYQALCRLIHIPTDSNKSRRLMERHIRTEPTSQLVKGAPNPAMATYIRTNSRKLATSKAEAERQIKERVWDKLRAGEEAATATSERVSEDEGGDSALESKKPSQQARKPKVDWRRGRGRR